MDQFQNEDIFVRIEISSLNQADYTIIYFTYNAMQSSEDNILKVCMVRGRVCPPTARPRYYSHLHDEGV